VARTGPNRYVCTRKYRLCPYEVRTYTCTLRARRSSCVRSTKPSAAPCGDGISGGHGMECAHPVPHRSYGCAAVARQINLVQSWYITMFGVRLKKQRNTCRKDIHHRPPLLQLQGTSSGSSTLYNMHLCFTKKTARWILEQSPKRCGRRDQMLARKHVSRVHRIPRLLSSDRKFRLKGFTPWFSQTIMRSERRRATRPTGT